VCCSPSGAPWWSSATTPPCCPSAPGFPPRRRVQPPATVGAGQDWTGHHLGGRRSRIARANSTWCPRPRCRRARRGPAPHRERVARSIDVPVITVSEPWRRSPSTATTPAHPSTHLLPGRPGDPGPLHSPALRSRFDLALACSPRSRSKTRLAARRRRRPPAARWWRASSARSTSTSSSSARRPASSASSSPSCRRVVTSSGSSCATTSLPAPCRAATVVEQRQSDIDRARVDHALAALRSLQRRGPLGPDHRRRHAPAPRWPRRPRRCTRGPRLSPLAPPAPVSDAIIDRIVPSSTPCRASWSAIASSRRWRVGEAKARTCETAWPARRGQHPRRYE